MQWFYNLKIRSKLLLGFGLVALISGLIGGIAVVKMKTLDDRDTYLFNNTAKPLAQLAKISTAFQRMRSDIFFILQNPTTDVIERYAKKIDERYAEIVEQQKNYEGTLLDKEDEENYRVLIRLNQEFYTLSQTILQQLRAHRAEEAKALYAGEGEADRVRLQDHISKMLKANEDAAQRISIENTDHYESTRNQLVILILIGLVVAMVIGKYIADYLSHAITLVVARIESLKNVEITALETSGERLASGDMNITLHTDESLLDVRSSDELGLLSGSINQISGKIAATIGSITRAVDAIKDTVVESNLLVAAAAHGNLSTRGDAAKFKGSYRELISGLNATVDAVVTPINESSLVLSKMAEGDLTVRMNGDYAGDYRIIKDSINQLAESLDRTLNEVAEAAEATASAANQISSSTEEMAAGAHEQTQQAAEVASAIEEMSKTIIEATRNATAASEMAQQAGARAKEGGEVMMETIGGMNRIAEVVKLSASTVQTLGASSDQIGEIVQTIDDIADQTNLLALNAAIEAARAGEQGRGFAVVADEVRKLAERTTKATKEIAQMIKQIQKETSFAVESMSRGTQEVEQGKVMADKSGTSLKEIIHGAEKVVDVITQVAAASEEQSTASEQISRNIEAISSVTQESAAGTQQIARAAEDLNRLTQNLQEILGKFSLTSRASLHEVRGMTRSTQSQSRETRQLRRA